MPSPQGPEEQAALNQVVVTLIFLNKNSVKWRQLLTICVTLPLQLTVELVGKTLWVSFTVEKLLKLKYFH